jgi:hypothetical protein
MRPELLAGTLLLTLSATTAQALEYRRGGSSHSKPHPFQRVMPAPVVFPAFHEAVRDNPAALRQDEAWSFQAMGGPNFSNSRHPIQGGAAWANGKFGVGAWADSRVGDSSSLDEMTLGFSAGTGAFSGGASVSLYDLAFNPMFTVGMLFGSTLGSHGAFSVHRMGSPFDNAYARLGYGYLNPEAFNFEIFAETPPFLTLPQGVFRLGMAAALFIDSWSIGFQASYGFNPAAGFTPGGSPGENAMRFSVGASKWLGQHFNFQLRFNEDLSLMAGFTLAFFSL